MAKQAKKIQAETQPVAAETPTTRYTVVPPKRPLTGVKYGVSGNAFTHAALADAAQQKGGTLTAAEAMAVCKACAHQSFFGYAVNRLRILQPVVASQQA